MPAIPTAPTPCPVRFLLARRHSLHVSYPSPCSNHQRLPPRLLRLPARPRAAPMSAEARAPASPVAPPAHPTYDLRAVIALALAEDAGDRGTQLATWCVTHASVLFAPLRFGTHKNTTALPSCLSLLSSTTVFRGVERKIILLPAFQ